MMSGAIKAGLPESMEFACLISDNKYAWFRCEENVITVSEAVV